MDKPLTYPSLADLLADYVTSYKQWWHTVLRIRIGLPVPHDVMFDGQVCSSPAMPSQEQSAVQAQHAVHVKLMCTLIHLQSDFIRNTIDIRICVGNNVMQIHCSVLIHCITPLEGLCLSVALLRL